MKKIIGYIILMIVVTIVMPLLIVRGCSTVIEEIIPPIHHQNHKEEEEKEPRKIKVYVKAKDKVVDMDFEEYIKSVVAAEMPVEFELEALKAQAVAARTYAYGRMKKIYIPKDDIHKGAEICTDSTHCQAWLSKEDALKKWGILNGEGNWNKISSAVKETEDVIILFGEKVVNPVFHSNSGGMTENAEDVWSGVNVPYLKSVKSQGEEASSGYKVVTPVKEKEFIDKFKKEYPDIKLNEKKLMNDIKILSYSDGGRIKEIKVGSVTLKGTDFRRIFNLRSTNFKIEKGKDGELNITTIGYGHGVGMSQWGANHLAKSGGSYQEILKYYYKDVSLDTIDAIEMLDSIK